MGNSQSVQVKEKRLLPASSLDIGGKELHDFDSFLFVCKRERRHVVESYCDYLSGWELVLISDARKEKKKETKTNQTKLSY